MNDRTFTARGMVGGLIVGIGVGSVYGADTGFVLGVCFFVGWICTRG